MTCKWYSSLDGVNLVVCNDIRVVVSHIDLFIYTLVCVEEPGGILRSKNKDSTLEVLLFYFFHLFVHN